MKTKIHEHPKTNRFNIEKTIFRTLSIMMVTAALIACKNEPKTDSGTKAKEEMTTEKSKLAFNDSEIDEQFQHYIHLKTALVNSDTTEAQSGAKMLMENTGDGKLKEMLSKIVETNDIAVQRMVFSDVTSKMTELVDASISSGEVYKQYCPMAFNNQGGYWLSTEKEIRNPYFGDKMLKCGKVAETIK